MTTRPTLKSDRAVAAALEAIGPCAQETSALLLFLAAARHFEATVGRKYAAETVYREADRIATRGD
jgi:hypothetical protein